MMTEKLPSGLFIRTFHTVLTTAVLLSLALTNTELRQAFENGKVAYVVSFSLLVVVTSGLYLVSSLMDPGYLPVLEYEVSKKRKSVAASSSDSDSSDENEDDVEKQEASQMLNSSKEPESGIKLRKCTICRVYQPVRTKHCEDCKRCVRKYDHHCPWLENCVGEANHRFFWMFLLTESALILWSLKITWGAFKPHHDPSLWLRANALHLLVLLILCVAAMAVISLLCCHSFMLFNNQTTWEFMSRHRITYLRNLDGSTNPFDEGLMKNCIKFFFYCPYRRWDRMVEKYCNPARVI